MIPGSIIEMTREALTLTLWLGSPLVLSAALIGLLVSFLQALTQIQDQTLAFAFKVIVVFVVLALLGGWIGTLLLQYGDKMFDAIVEIK
ncbi:MAG: type III secretion system export apparatus subunit SctS [Burkholderiaceae bacterium]